MRVLETRDNLPPKPAGVEIAATTSLPKLEGPTNAPESIARKPAVAAPFERLTSLSEGEKMDVTLSSEDKKGDGWNWQRSEDARLSNM